MNATAEALLKSSATTSDPAIARHVERLSREMDAMRTLKFDPTGPTAQRFSEVYAELLHYAMSSRRRY